MKSKSLGIILLIWSIIFIGTGIYLNKDNKPIVKNKYSVTVYNKKEVVFRTTELKLKDIETELNTPISLNISDYISNYNELDKTILDKLKLDTSEIKVNEAGTYRFTISWSKKRYSGIYKVNNLRTPELTLKNLKYSTKTILSTTAKDYINEKIADEIAAELKLDLTKVDTNQTGSYQYTITYHDKMYTGNIEIFDNDVTLIPSKDIKIETNSNNKSKQ